MPSICDENEIGMWPQNFTKTVEIFFFFNKMLKHSAPAHGASMLMNPHTKEPLSHQYDIAHVSKKLSNCSLRNCSSSVLLGGGSNQAVFNSTVLIFRNVLDCYIST